MRLRSPLTLAGVFCGATLAISACGSSASPSSTTSSPSPSPTLAQAHQERPSATPEQATQGVLRFKYVEPSGVTVAVKFSYSRQFVADDPQLVTTWHSLSSLAPTTTCAQNPSRDVVVVGALSLENLTPDYPPTGLAFRMIRPDVWNANTAGMYQGQFYIHTTGHEDCDPDYEFVAPDLSGTSSWGPAPVEYVIPSGFGPSGYESFVKAELKNIKIQAFAPQGGLCDCVLRPGEGTRNPYTSEKASIELRANLT